MIDDIEAFEQSYRALENSLGDYNVGQAIRLLSGIDPADDRWDTVIEHEVRRVVQLHAAHYTQFQKGNTIVAHAARRGRRGPDHAQLRRARRPARAAAGAAGRRAAGLARRCRPDRLGQ
jgi:hypothetical protein